MPFFHVVDQRDPTMSSTALAHRPRIRGNPSSDAVSEETPNTAMVLSSEIIEPDLFDTLDGPSIVETARYRQEMEALRRAQAPALDARRAEQRAQADRLSVKNRRKRYLELHPEYFSSADLQYAHPILFDRLIRRFQTAREREEAGRNTTFSGSLMSTYLRSRGRDEELSNPVDFSLITPMRGANGDILPEDPDDIPKDKEEGLAWWTDIITQNFLAGSDETFEYDKIDHNHDYDDPEEERDLEEAYFDGESD